MKKYIISLFSVSLLAVSCKDFLHREPVEAISITDQFSTEQGLLEAVNGLYKTFRNTYIGSVSATTYGDLLSGNLAFSPNASINRGTIEAPVSVKKIYDFDDSKLNSDGIMRSFYTNSYQLINNINLVLENVDKVATSDEVKQRVKAEALTLRAYAHFQLMKYFSQNYTYTSDASHLGIIYNTRVQKVGVDYPSRPTIKQNMEQLQADISQAISLFQTDTPAVPAGKKSYFASKTMAQTLAADIALWKNDWQTACD
ncbi:MAG: RagB/SusD family nutrient uptake outer membrane protein, partial [Bergeyella zoohelcum]|nr:RagB/SusD family nutrient uptake outer membrane protein [Bergeyella zoohelcum]